eukprot:scpid94195/ scgid18618/ 
MDRIRCLQKEVKPHLQKGDEGELEFRNPTLKETERAKAVQKKAKKERQRICGVRRIRAQSGCDMVCESSLLRAEGVMPCKKGAVFAKSVRDTPRCKAVCEEYQKLQEEAAAKAQSIIDAKVLTPPRTPKAIKKAKAMKEAKIELYYQRIPGSDKSIKGVKVGSTCDTFPREGVLERRSKPVA